MKLKTAQLLSLLEKYTRLRELYLDSYAQLAELRDCMREGTGKYDMKDMVSFIYIMREVSTLANDLRKECDGIQKMFENSVCAIWVIQGNNKPIRSALATGSPDLKLGVSIPNQKREPEAFKELMEYFKIPENVIEDNILKPYWPGLCEHISQLAEEGKPLPPGIDPNKTYPTYSVRIKRRKDLDELGRDLTAAGRKEVDEARENLLTSR